MDLGLCVVWRSFFCILSTDVFMMYVGMIIKVILNIMIMITSMNYKIMNFSEKVMIDYR